MDNDKLFDQEANEANLNLNADMNDGDINLFAIGSGGEDSAARANMKIQEALDGENHQEEIFPNYMNNNTPAIKVSGKSK